MAGGGESMSITAYSERVSLGEGVVIEDLASVKPKVHFVFRFFGVSRSVHQVRNHLVLCIGVRLRLMGKVTTDRASRRFAWEGVAYEPPNGLSDLHAFQHQGNDRPLLHERRGFLVDSRAKSFL